MAKEAISEAGRVEWPLMKWQELAKVAATGIVVGLVGLALYYMLNKYVFDRILCRPDSIGRCANKNTYSSGVAMVLVAAGALFSLVQQRVYRSLMVVLAATVSLWNIFLLAGSLGWFVRILVVAIIFGLAYAVFAWLAQVRNLLVAAIATVVVVALARIILL